MALRLFCEVSGPARQGRYTPIRSGEPGTAGTPESWWAARCHTPVHSGSVTEVGYHVNLSWLRFAGGLRTRGYDPARFLGMLAQSGSAVSVARQLFADPCHTSYGFECLWEMSELGRSIEFAANLPWFRSLFTDDELDEARSRLILHDFPADERLAAAAAHPPQGAEE
jgi:hypothetical protein